jgi:hypothetical protein
MKINEITKFNKDISSTLTGRHTPDMDKILADKGWTYIDQGHYSATYLSPNKKTVLKINRDFDPGYEHFIKVIKYNPNPHFPVISDKKKLPDGTSAYIMERLYDLDESDKKIENAIVDIMHFIVTGVVFDSHAQEYYESCVDKVEEQQPGIMEALKILAKYRGTFKNDIRFENIMKRKDGTIVIIDPYAGKQK